MRGGKEWNTKYKQQNGSLEVCAAPVSLMLMALQFTLPVGKKK